jgi:tetratricopeptide (TPR) repeat protein
MFLVGEPAKNIRSMCFVAYANYLNENGNDDNKALHYYNKALDLNLNYYAYGGLATILFKKKQFQDALTLCNKADSIKQNILIDILLFIGHRAMGDIRASEIMLERINNFFNNDKAVAFDRIANSYFLLKMYQEAETYAKAAVQILPKEAGIHYNLAQVYVAQQRLLDARRELEAVLQLAIDSRLKNNAKQKLKFIQSALNKSER